MTTETDRELLELAAKAAELDVEYIDKRGFEWRRNAPKAFYPKVGINEWNPLTNDGDALRLAVKLGLFAEYDCASQLQAISEVPGVNPYADVRRAIVRAAAEIGRAMK